MTFAEDGPADGRQLAFHLTSQGIDRVWSRVWLTECQLEAKSILDYAAKLNSYCMQAQSQKCQEGTFDAQQGDCVSNLAP